MLDSRLILIQIVKSVMHCIHSTFSDNSKMLQEETCQLYSWYVPCATVGDISLYIYILFIATVDIKFNLSRSTAYDNYVHIWNVLSMWSLFLGEH